MSKEKPSENIPVLDEGWWASVLADEDGIASSKPLQNLTYENNYENVDWDLAKEIHQRDQILSMQVTDYNRGGVLVGSDGLFGFVPCSHIVSLQPNLDDKKREQCLAALVDTQLQLKIIECDPQDGKIIFSERAALSEAGTRSQLLDELRVGQCSDGEVTNITEFGAFVDLGGLEGLIHISELSWGRVKHPGEVLSVGQQVEVLVLEVAADRGRVALSLKRLQPNPWEGADSRYPEGSQVQAEITALVSFGAFARLEEGLEGLIHISEIDIPPGKQLEDRLDLGQMVEVRILQVEPERQRLGLSLK